ncbi:MAG: rhomboid family intramembrane serine protease [candidate division WOR-3 bacterium]|nr:MAG: rhomboid family intramembrane serine protease [candidate division WOR-3 bacterium]
MLPLKDNLRSRTRPVVVYAILAANILVYIYEISLGPALNDFVRQFGVVPYSLFHPTGIESYLTVFTSMFIHADSIMHIVGNMLFLWIFADNVEDRMGHLRFLLFYFFCGICAALLQSAISPASKIPMIGASGAVSGVLGAYILLFPKARVLALIPLGFFLRISYLPSFIFLGIWFLYQFLFGFSSLGARGGVAYFAHIGGFIAGLLLALPFKRKRKTVDYDIY